MARWKIDDCGRLIGMSEDGEVATAPPRAKHGCDLHWNGMEWLHIPASKQDRTAERARQARNAMLAKSDWTQLPDVPKATRDRWKKYRQALRDITEQMGFPEVIVWPEKP